MYRQPCFRRFRRRREQVAQVRENTSMKFDYTGNSDRRAFSRQNCDIAAQILLGSTKIHECILRDVSASGARISVPHGIWQPYEFNLAIEGSDDLLPVRRIWSGYGCIGVQFIEQELHAPLVSMASRDLNSLPKSEWPLEARCA